MQQGQGTAPATPSPAPTAGYHGDPAKGQQLATTVCAACHGADGNSAIPAQFPSLAGQHAAYLYKQLRQFKSGERKNPIMQGMAAPLTADQMLDVAAYYAAQTPRPTTGVRIKELAAHGEMLWRGGNLQSGVPACAGCHAPDGSGIPAQFPRLSGLHADYILNELKIFRAGERGSDADNVMRTIAGRLNDYEMKAVAEFIGGLRSTAGQAASSASAR